MLMGLACWIEADPGIDKDVPRSMPCGHELRVEVAPIHHRRAMGCWAHPHLHHNCWCSCISGCSCRTGVFAANAESSSCAVVSAEKLVCGRMNCKSPALLAGTSAAALAAAELEGVAAGVLLLLVFG